MIQRFNTCDSLCADVQVCLAHQGDLGISPWIPPQASPNLRILHVRSTSVMRNPPNPHPLVRSGPRARRPRSCVEKKKIPHTIVVIPPVLLLYAARRS